jgi:nanoRNase/pAp phosphatase (c-di-AMP/oligoRNAs hydrolase)
MNVVIYHAGCSDGFCAALYFWKFLKDCKFIPLHYGWPVPSDLQPDDIVYLVDFSFKKPELYQLSTMVKKVVVLDHHKTAAAELADKVNDNVEIYFDMDRSGATLAYDYFIAISANCTLGTGHLPSYKKPLLAAYVQDRDLWEFKLPFSKAISAYLRSLPLEFNIWNGLEEVLQTEFMVLVFRGESILNFQQRQIENAANSAVVVPFPINPEGLTWPAAIVNCPTNQSEVGDALCLDGHCFAVMWFMSKEGKFVYSLRSRGDFDVSKIAKAFGGGGHKNAAGFTADTLIWIS